MAFFLQTLHPSPFQSIYGPHHWSVGVCPISYGCIGFLFWTFLPTLRQLSNDFDHHCLILYCFTCEKVKGNLVLINSCQMAALELHDTEGRVSRDAVFKAIAGLNATKPRQQV